MARHNYLRDESEKGLSIYISKEALRAFSFLLLELVQTLHRTDTLLTNKPTVKMADFQLRHIFVRYFLSEKMT